MGRAHASIPLFLKKGSIFKIGQCLRGFYGRAIKHKALFLNKVAFLKKGLYALTIKIWSLPIISISGFVIRTPLYS